MGVYKSVKGVSKSSSGLRAAIKYVVDQKKHQVYKITGINCSSDWKKALKDFKRTKEIYGKTDGRQYKHHIQSFKPGEVTPEMAHKLGVEFAEKYLKDFDVIIATHTEKGHIHNHFIINSVCRTNGMKLNELSTKQYEEYKAKGKKLEPHELCLDDLKEKNNELSRKYGLSVIEKKGKPKSLNIYDMKEYQVVKKHMENKERSYKVDLAMLVEQLSKLCKSKEEFIKEMKEHTIDVEWFDHRKNVVFKFQQEEGEKPRKSIRLSNLFKTFNQKDCYDKEKLLDLFKRNEMEMQLKQEEEKTKQVQTKQQEMQKQQEEQKTRENSWNTRAKKSKTIDIVD